MVLNNCKVNVNVTCNELQKKVVQLMTQVLAYLVCLVLSTRCVPRSPHHSPTVTVCSLSSGGNNPTLRSNSVHCFCSVIILRGYNRQRSWRKVREWMCRTARSAPFYPCCGARAKCLWFDTLPSVHAPRRGATSHLSRPPPFGHLASACCSSTNTYKIKGLETPRKTRLRLLGFFKLACM